MICLEVLLVELYIDYGIDLIRSMVGMLKEVEEKIIEFVEELVKLLQGCWLLLKNVKEVNVIFDEVVKVIKVQYIEIVVVYDVNLW